MVNIFDATKWDIRFIRLAREVATWSKDPSTKVGCVITNELNQVVSLGYNGFPRHIEDDTTRYEDRPTKYRLVVHSEPNAILNAVGSLQDTTLYVTPLPPCHECAKLIIQAGIKNVVFEVASDDSRWQESFEWSKLMFEEAGIYCMRYSAATDTMVSIT